MCVYLRLINYFDLFKTDFNGVREMMFPRKEPTADYSSSQCNGCLNTRKTSIILFEINNCISKVKGLGEVVCNLLSGLNMQTQALGHDACDIHVN